MLTFSPAFPSAELFPRGLGVQGGEGARAGKPRLHKLYSRPSSLPKCRETLSEREVSLRAWKVQVAAVRLEELEPEYKTTVRSFTEPF